MCVLSGDHPELNIVRHKTVRQGRTEPSVTIKLG